MLHEMIEEGKRELHLKRKREIETTVFDNPYEKLVYKVHLRQKDDLKRIENNKQLFQENMEMISRVIAMR